MATFIRLFIELARETWHTAWRVLKLIIPVTFIVKAIDLLGFIDVVAKFLSPAFEFIGLPASFGLVWTTTAIANIYSGLYVFLNYTQNQTFTTAQVTVLATMMLLAHSLLIELEVANRVGVKRWFMALVRIGSVFLAGGFLSFLFKITNTLQKTNVSILPKVEKAKVFIWYKWLAEQFVNYAVLIVIIFLILLMMRLLKYFGVIDFLQEKFQPIVSKLGMSKEIIPMTIIGLLLGLVFGAALIMKEKEENKNIKKKEFVYAMVLLGLCHAIVEDTLFVMGIGASLWGVLVFRVIYSFIFTYLFVKVSKMPIFKTKLSKIGH